MAKQPVCTAEQARKLLADLKSVYQTLPASQRNAVKAAVASSQPSGERLALTA